MAEVVYLLCAIASMACAVLLVRSYISNRMPLILWTGLCFVGMAVNNVLLFIDLAVAPNLDLSFWRNATALASVAVLLYGLISSDLVS